MRTIAQRLFDRTQGSPSAIFSLAERTAQSIEEVHVVHNVLTITFWDDSVINLYADIGAVVEEQE